MTTVDRVRELVIGKSFSNVEYADSWSLSFPGELYLFAQALELSTDALVERALRAEDPTLLDSVDLGIVPTAASVFAILRREIVDVALGEAGELVLTFDRGARLVAQTNTDIVDWQWSIAVEHTLPYSGHEVACFWRGEVVVNRGAGG